MSELFSTYEAVGCQIEHNSIIFKFVYIYWFGWLAYNWLFVWGCSFSLPPLNFLWSFKLVGEIEFCIGETLNNFINIYHVFTQTNIYTNKYTQTSNPLFVFLWPLTKLYKSHYSYSRKTSSFLPKTKFFPTNKHTKVGIW